jgi:hypothetical protein
VKHDDLTDDVVREYRDDHTGLAEYHERQGDHFAAAECRVHAAIARGFLEQKAEIERLRVLERAVYSEGRDTYSWVFINHRNTPLADAIKEAEQEVQP